MKRIIRDIPDIGIEIAPPGAVIVDGFLDYLTEDQTPGDALYVAEMDDKDNVTVIKDDTTVAIRHTFAGWPLTKIPQL